MSEIHPDIIAFNKSKEPGEREICEALAVLLVEYLPEAEYKIWHRHPVWFLNENPIVGYGKLKAGIRLMFWSGASFDESDLKQGSGKFKDASIIYTAVEQIDPVSLKRWVDKAKVIQWDYKNIYKRKGKLIRLK